MITNFIFSFFCSHACLDAKYTAGRQYSLITCTKVADQACTEPDAGYFYTDWEKLRMGAWVAGELPRPWAFPRVRSEIVYRDLIPGC